MSDRHTQASTQRQQLQAELSKADQRERLTQLTAPALVKRCTEETQEPCWIVSNDVYHRPPVCTAFMQATGLANSYADAKLPALTPENLAGKPWVAGYQEWQTQGKLAEMHPKAMVWDAGLGKAFTAAGDCLSAYRATSQCKAQGGQQCALVVQDDIRIGD